MFLDASTDAASQVLESDLCIIGAGAAGIALALEFEGTKHKVVLIESGSYDFDPETQALYEGSITGLPYFPLDATRLRYFGGTTNHWTGWCRPLDEIDFLQRDWVPNSGWPFSRSELNSYYKKATEILDLGGTDFGRDAMASVTGARDELTHRLDPEKLVVHTFRMSPPTRMGQKFRDQITTSQNIHCLLNANVTEILAAETANYVRQVDCKTLAGKRFSIRAKQYVLAAGGLENPRILLNSRTVQKNGLGNGRDLVGRYFMDHIEMALGIIALHESLKPIAAFLRPTKNMQSSIAVSPSIQARLGILNVNATFNEIHSIGEASIGFGAMRRIVRGLQRGEWPSSLWRDLGYIAGDIDEVGRYVWSKVLGKKDDAICVIMNRSETTPNSSSRVTLSEEKDHLGLQKIQLHWQLSDLDRRSIYHFQRTLGEEIGRLSLGRVRIGLDEVASSWPPNLDGGHHHMGTTRMHDHAMQGVVDRNCKVHGLANLYVAGSSVFPTCGNANPTLTIVALSLRLAENLKQVMT